MLLLFASCLNCYVHGAFLFCGESCLKFIVKYKAVSLMVWEDSHFRPAWEKNRWLLVCHFGKSWKVVMAALGVLCAGESPRCSAEMARVFSGSKVWLLVAVSGVRLGFVFVYENNNFNQIYLFFFFGVKKYAPIQNEVCGRWEWKNKQCLLPYWKRKLDYFL